MIRQHSEVLRTKNPYQSFRCFQESKRIHAGVCDGHICKRLTQRSIIMKQKEGNLYLDCFKIGRHYGR